MQAILILAHRDIEYVINLSLKLKQCFEVYIHFDQKFKVSDEYKKILDDNNIYYTSEIKVNWGSWSIAAAAVCLMKMAIQNPEITHVHLISGMDYPVINVQIIYEFYENNNNIYMQCSAAKDIVKSHEPILYWQKFYFNYDKINRKSTYGKIYHRISILKQKLFKVDKFKDLGVTLEIYHGANWMDLPRDAVEYLLKYITENKNVLKVFETGYCPDEFWAQTILYNSTFRSRIVNDIHRYISWTNRNNSYPAILDVSDYDSIKNGNFHFARKVTTDISNELIKQLDENEN